MSDRRPIILLAHGSPDPDWQLAPQRIVELARALASQQHSPRRIEIAFLEHSRPRLDELVATLIADGVQEVLVVALLLSGGGRHFKVDLPRLVSDLSVQHPGFVATLHPQPLGVLPEVLEAMARAALGLE